LRVALGTLEVDDAARKKIRKELGAKGHATRGEVKDYLLAALENDVIPQIGNVPPASPPGDEEEEPEIEYTDEAGSPWPAA
jgi:hypothetical protein